RKRNEPDRAPRSRSRGREGRWSVGDDVHPRFVAVGETDSHPLEGSIQKRSHTKKKKGRSLEFPSWITKRWRGLDLNRRTHLPPRLVQSASEFRRTPSRNQGLGNKKS